MSRTLQVVTYNIHKGLSLFNRRLVIHELRDRLRTLGSDIVFLQEVQGNCDRSAARHGGDWPVEPQYEFLADTVWGDFAYGRNAVYDHGHHGNAILSRYPIQHWDNQDVSAHRFEKRGLLHCEVAIPGWDVPLHCVCVHLAWSLENLVAGKVVNQITVPAREAELARIALDRMLAVS